MPKSRATAKVAPPVQAPATPPRPKGKRPAVAESGGKAKFAGRKAAAEVRRRIADVEPRKLDFSRTSSDDDSSAAEEQQWPGTGPELCQQLTDLKDHIYYDVCTLRRKPGRWVTCPKSIMEVTIDQIVREGKVTSQDRFLDLGCAGGHVVFSMATRLGCRGTGVELVKENYRLACEAAPHFREHWKATKADVPEVEFVNADIRKWLPGREKDYSVVWLANMLMPLEVDACIIRCMRNFRPGTRIFMMKDLVAHNHLDWPGQAEDALYFKATDLNWPEDGVEWERESRPYYMYTRTDYMGEES